jgi:hypothetical protein
MFYDQTDQDELNVMKSPAGKMARKAIGMVAA